MEFLIVMFCMSSSVKFLFEHEYQEKTSWIQTIIDKIREKKNMETSKISLKLELKRRIFF